MKVYIILNPYSQVSFIRLNIGGNTGVKHNKKRAGNLIIQGLLNELAGQGFLDFFMLHVARFSYAETN